MKNKISILILTILLSLSWSSSGLSLTEATHEAINAYVAQKGVNDFSLNDYLMNNLGLGKGVNEIINGVDADGIDRPKEVFWWVQYGGIREDRPGSWKDYLPLIGQPTRSVNHFHNPLPWKSWEEAGLDDYLLGHRTGESQVLWAQNPNQDPGGGWSWYDAREYFYSALTGKDFDGKVVVHTYADMQQYYANTFRALGQLMHLVQDASVPEHVRNQIHIQKAYEAKVDNFRTDTKKYPLLWGSFLANPLGFDKSILGIPSTDPLAPLAISRIIDTDKYDGSNPDITKTLPGPLQPIGISEYTNANFLSKHTMFTDDLDPTDRHYFPYPRGASAIRWKDNTNKRWYVKKTGEGDTVNHLAAVSWQQSYVEKNYPDLSVLWRKVGSLDDECYREYASKLIPRAVGYSSGLLKYFFRGELHIEILLPSVDQLPYACGSKYCFLSRDEMGTDIDAVAVILQNNSKLNNSIEPAGKGDLTLTIGYTDTTSGSRVYQTAGTVSVAEIPAVGSGYTLPILFSLAQPIPTLTTKDLVYYFAFKGKLGQEEDAVIGKVVKAPVLYSASPDRGTEGTVVTLTGDKLPDPADAYNSESQVVCFVHDMIKPYSIELVSRTETEITVKMPNTAGLEKPGYGGIRAKNVLPGEEVIFSNPINFFPIAEGEIMNFGKDPIDVTIAAEKPMYGDYDQLPLPLSYHMLPGGVVSIQLMAGFTYHVTGGKTDTMVDIVGITPDPVDFIIGVQ